jgi:hypothetical protein
MYPRRAARPPSRRRIPGPHPPRPISTTHTPS